jgi:hypothetical protein
MLRHYRMTMTEYAALPKDEQAFMLGYELYRGVCMTEWRKALIGTEEGKSNFTPETATLLLLGGL